MALGLSTSKADVDQQAGSLALSLHTTMTNARSMKAWLDTKTVGDLEALGYSTNEANTIKSAFTDFDQLAQVYFGLATRNPAYDYRTFIKLLYRFGF
jgi:hypothetical protein